jgi:hypothetical protein
MILSGKDLIVIAASVSVIAAGATGLYVDYTSRISTNRTDQIGTITFKKKTAERKYGDQMIWEDVGQESPVYNNDTLRTADGSSAMVKLSDGTKIDLDENTLVMLALTAAGANIDLAGGSIFANTGEGGAAKGAVNISSGGAKIAVKGGSLNLTKTADKAIDLSVSSGSATVTGAAGPVSVGANQILKVSSGKTEMQKVSISLESPAPNAYSLIVGPAVAEITFSWKGDAGRASVEIASDRAFKKNLIRKNGVSGLSERFSKGDYYWRVSGAGGESETRKFSVLEDSAVMPLSPSSGEKLSFRGKISRIPLSWSGSRYASSYRVELSRDAAFTGIAVSIPSLTTSASAENLSEGNYFWRVIPVYDFMNPRNEVKTASFSVVSRSELSSPEAVYPEDESRIGIVAASGGGFSFGWGRLAECDSYILEVAKDPGFKELISTDSTTANFIAKTLPAAEASYYWRVSGHAPDGAVSRPSAYRRLTVEKTHPPVQLSVQQENESSFLFKWKDPDALGKYRIEISKGKDFTEAFKRAESAVPSVSIRDIPLGEYSWRVSSLDGRGAVAGVSESERLSVSGFLEKPVPVFPIDNVRLEIMSMKTLDFSWKAEKNITVYELEIHQYSFASDKLMYKADVTGGKCSINPFTVLSTGNFYWQVTAVRKSGNEVLARSAPSRGYFNIPQGPEIKAPKLGNMKVYVE